MKTCSRCKVERPLSAFGVEKKKRDGLTAWCRSCKTEHQRERQALLRKDPAWAAQHVMQGRLGRRSEPKPKECPVCKKEKPSKEMYAEYSAGLENVRWRCRECALVETGQSIPRVCLWCQDPFTAPRHAVRRGGGRYCSQKCRNAWMRSTAEHMKDVPVQGRSRSEDVYLSDRY